MLHAMGNLVKIINNDGALINEKQIQIGSIQINFTLVSGSSTHRLGHW